MARNNDAQARVFVFIDGQNLFKSCERAFGHGRCHPLMLADSLAGGRKLVGVRFYSGLHDPTKEPEKNARANRRHDLMRKSGITVVERRLRYRWEWGIDARSLPPAEESIGTTRQLAAKPYQRAREKGIDLAMGLDVMEAAISDQMDVAVIVSSDTDLCEAARSTRKSTSVSVEAAVVNDGTKAFRMQHYDYTHQINDTLFDNSRDDMDYSQQIPVFTREAYVRSCAQFCVDFLT